MTMNTIPSLPYHKSDYLTSRQSEILDCLLVGMTNKVMAARFKCKESTMRHHMSEIYSKYGIPVGGVQRVLLAVAVTRERYGIY